MEQLKEHKILASVGVGIGSLGLLAYKVALRDKAALKPPERVAAPASPPGDDCKEHMVLSGYDVVEEIDLKTCTVQEPPSGPNTPYTQLGEAKSVVFRRYASGVREMDIVHPDIQGVTPAEMLWFWRRLGHYIRVGYDGTYGEGSELMVYRLWHQRDHVRLFRGEGDKPGPNEWVIDEGSEFRIEEWIQQKHHVDMDIKQQVSQFDEQNFSFWLNVGGLRVGHLDHFMRPDGKGNTEFRVRMRVGVPGWRLFNRLLPSLSCVTDQFMFDWALHNIEESGESQKIVPKLRKLPDLAFVSRDALRGRTVTIPQIARGVQPSPAAP